VFGTMAYVCGINETPMAFVQSPHGGHEADRARPPAPHIGQGCLEFRDSRHARHPRRSLAQKPTRR
jgi:hypothetical protein